jgi:hypothetical protein
MLTCVFKRIRESISFDGSVANPVQLRVYRYLILWFSNGGAPVTQLYRNILKLKRYPPEANFGILQCHNSQLKFDPFTPILDAYPIMPHLVSNKSHCVV